MQADSLGVVDKAAEAPAPIKETNEAQPSAEMVEIAPGQGVEADTAPGDRTEPAAGDETSPLVARILEGQITEQIIADLVGKIATSEKSAKVLSELAEEVAAETRSETATSDLRTVFRSALDTGLQRLRLDPDIEAVGSGDDESGPSLLVLLEEYGISPRLDQPIPSPEQEDARPIDRRIPPRLYLLESVRYILLVGLAAIGACCGWVVAKSVSISGLIDGAIPASDIEALEDARRLYITVLGLALALVTLWSSVVASHARRAGVPTIRMWHYYASMGSAAALNVVAFAVDGGTRGTFSLLCLIGCLAGALVCMVMLTEVVRRFDCSTTKLILWSGCLIMVIVVSWLGGLHKPIEPTRGLDSLTFFAASAGIIAFVTVVFAALSTSEIEDRIRVSPGLAQLPQAHRPE
jgi:hypothetical protein